METKIIYQIVKNCSNCNGKCTARTKIKDNTGYYENKMLSQGENPSFRCTNCREIKPIDNFSLIEPKKSKRRRKFCRECRNKQMRERYYKRKEEKLKEEPKEETKEEPK
jgi:hypothetical protein